MRAAIIANPGAGALKRKPKLVEALQETCREQDGVHWFSAQTDAELQGATAAIAEASPSLIGILGGDGTASVVLTDLHRGFAGRDLPTIALLRGGTMNTVANSLGISRRSPRRLLRRALSTVETPHTSPVQRRRVLDVGGRLGFLFGTGVMYGFLAEYYDAGHGDPTPRTALKVFTRCVASSLVQGSTYKRILNAESMTVAHEGGTWEAETYITVGAGSVAQVGLGFTPFARCEQSPDRFHLLAVNGRPRDIARDLPRVWLGRGMRPETAHEATTGWAELRAPAPFGYFVDGDLLNGSSTLRIAAGPALNLLCI